MPDTRFERCPLEMDDAEISYVIGFKTSLMGDSGFNPRSFRRVLVQTTSPQDHKALREMRMPKACLGMPHLKLNRREPAKL